MKKIIGIFIVTIFIGAITLPVIGKTIEPSNNVNNRNEIYYDYFIVESNYILNNGIDDFIIKEMERIHIPGLSASIVKNNEVFWTESYGYADISQEILVEDTILFMLASISKTITATAIMQLYEDGLFDLYDSINDYLPFQVIHPDYPSNDITFHMLLTHSSSINDNWDVMPNHIGDSPIPLGTYLEEYLTPGGEYYYSSLNFNPTEPGTSYDYCNIAVALVGYLVEVLSGIPFDEYCEINIFNQLDMDETAWFLADLDVNNIAIPYQWDGDEYNPYDHYGYSDYPSGQLRTSVMQLGNFLMMMMNNGEYNSVELLNQNTVNLMLSPQLIFEQSQGIIWYTWEIDGRTLWGHTGGSEGVTTAMFFDPETNIGVNMLTNGEFRNRDIINLLSTLFDFAENTPPETPNIDGSSSGKIRVVHEYIISTSDPEENDVSFFVDWGDDTSTDWTDFVESGEEITLTHKWSKEGTYIIKVKAKDGFGAETDWATLEVSMPKTKSISYFNPLIKRLIERFPILEILL